MASRRTHPSYYWTPHLPAHVGPVGPWGRASALGQACAAADPDSPDLRQGLGLRRAKVRMTPDVADESDTHRRVPDGVRLASWMCSVRSARTLAADLAMFVEPGTGTVPAT